jgi:2-polyprenyl-6-methoxyphenol hydroxylase-like FAD-dependent oxidoreductase
VTDPAQTIDKLSTTCCIVGGGPAGMMLGLLLARAGVDVVVLEKHADFLRDFRGDTIHPSTLEVMYELGLLDALLKLPHQKAATLRGWVGDLLLTVADFSHLPTRCGFIAFMPQWDFLNFLVREASSYPTFALRMQAEASDVIDESGQIVGVRAATPAGALEVRADLVVGADGRHSVIRQRSGLVVDDFGAPMDVLWFSLPRRPADPSETTGRFDTGRIFVAINRDDEWQCGFVIPKDSIAKVQARGLAAFRVDVAAMAPYVADRVEQIRDWEQVKLLTVCVDRLRQWSRPGLLCIGDAAHAMSPIGGVGINLAIQDAVAAANLLAAPLRERRLGDEHLRQVQRRRELPTRLTQGAQLLVQKRVVTPVLGGTGPIAPPLAVRLIARFPFLCRIPGRLVGMGVRPEHVRTPSISKNLAG